MCWALLATWSSDGLWGLEPGFGRGHIYAPLRVSASVWWDLSVQRFCGRKPGRTQMLPQQPPRVWGDGGWAHQSVGLGPLLPPGSWERLQP